MRTLLLDKIITLFTGLGIIICRSMILERELFSLSSLVIILVFAFFCRELLLCPIDTIIGKQTIICRFKKVSETGTYLFFRKRCYERWTFYNGSQVINVTNPVSCSKGELPTMEIPAEGAMVRISYYRLSKLLCDWEMVEEPSTCHLEMEEIKYEKGIIKWIKLYCTISEDLLSYKKPICRLLLLVLCSVAVFNRPSSGNAGVDETVSKVVTLLYGIFLCFTLVAAIQEFFSTLDNRSLIRRGQLAKEHKISTAPLPAEKVAQICFKAYEMNFEIIMKDELFHVRSETDKYVTCKKYYIGEKVYLLFDDFVRGLNSISEQGNLNVSRVNGVDINKAIEKGL